MSERDAPRHDGGAGAATGNGRTFRGPDIETALHNAVREVGPDLTVAEARRVRRGGLLGFFAREHYEVEVDGAGDPTGWPGRTAGPVGPPGGDPTGDLNGDSNGNEHARAHLDETLRTLVERVEDWEDSGGGRLPGGVASREPSDDLDLLPPLDFAAELEEAARNAEATRNAEAARNAEEHRPPPHVSVEKPSLYDNNSTETCGERPARPGEPGWSLAALEHLGMPRVVLDRLGVSAPALAGDAAWTAALAAAIDDAALSPGGHAAGGGDAPAVWVSGEGAEAAVELVKAAVAGLAPGTLHRDGEAARATAFELALGVRACLPR